MNEALRFRELLLRHMAGTCELSEDQIELLYAHYCQMARWNKVLNLTSIRDLEEVVVRHYCESLFLGIHLPHVPMSVVDVGSGAGFPGIPLAVLMPESHFTLVESRQRKAVFLQECTRGRRNVTVVGQRAETVDGSFGWLVSRAVRCAEVLRLLPRLSKRVGLLIGDRDVQGALRAENLQWEKPIRLPWSSATAVLIGEHVPRGTPRVTDPLQFHVKHDRMI